MRHDAIRVSSNQMGVCLVGEGVYVCVIVSCCPVMDVPLSTAASGGGVDTRRLFVVRTKRRREEKAG